MRLVGASVVAAMVLAQTPVMAQTNAAPSTGDAEATVQTEAPVAPQTNTTPSGAVAAAAVQTEIPEVVVTAERHTSTAQKTPATIEVLDGADLKTRGVGSLNEALNDVSGVFVQMNNKGADINIRGVGTGLDSAAGDPGVNTNIDGVYIRQASAIASGLFDLERMEVLKGPQGTLYGRNATGGVVNVLTADPSFDYGYHGSITAGNYNLIQTDAALNVPLSSTVALRAAFGSQSHDGYYDSGQDDAQSVGGRVKLLWMPSQSLRVLTGISYSHEGGVGPGSISASEPEGSRHADTSGDPAGHLDQRFVNGFSTVEWDTGPVKITFLPTYSQYVYNSIGTAYGFYSRQHARENQLTSELRFSSPASSRIEWVGGLYFYQDILSNYANLLNEGIVNDQPDLRTTSYASFADVTYPLADELKVIAGIRYTRDHKTQSDTTVTGGGTTVGPFAGELTSQAANYRVGLQYDVTPKVLTYATFATGYKAGGFTPDEPGFNTFQPERLSSIEAGVKSRFLGNRLQLNVSGYYYNYKNYQVSSLGIAHYGGLSALVFNATGQTKIFGLDAQMVYRLTPADRFDLNLSPLHSKFGTLVVPATVASATINSSGMELPSAPGLSGTLGYQHEWEIGSEDRLTARVDSYFSTAYWADFAHSAYSHRPGYTRTDLNLTYYGKNDRWSLGAYARNVENSWIVTLKADTPGGDFALDAPRTFGVTMTLRN